MTVPSTRTAHSAHLTQTKVAKKQQRPLGNYTHAEHQWGVIDAIHVGPPSTVDVYLDGSQNTGDTNNLVLGLSYLASYTPTVGDTVIIQRGIRRNRTSRVVLGKLYGSASPYPLPLGSIQSGLFVKGPNSIWGGAGAPTNAIGIAGDFYFRTNATATANERVYVRQSGGWVGIL